MHYTTYGPPYFLLDPLPMSIQPYSDLSCWREAIMESDLEPVSYLTLEKAKMEI